MLARGRSLSEEAQWLSGRPFCQSESNPTEVPPSRPLGLSLQETERRGSVSGFLTLGFGSDPGFEKLPGKEKSEFR